MPFARLPGRMYYRCMVLAPSGDSTSHHQVLVAFPYRFGPSVTAGRDRLPVEWCHRRHGRRSKQEVGYGSLSSGRNKAVLALSGVR